MYAVINADTQTIVGRLHDTKKGATKAAKEAARFAGKIQVVRIKVIAEYVAKVTVTELDPVDEDA